jgi:hypothetical protein
MTEQRNSRSPLAEISGTKLSEANRLDQSR